MVPDIRLIALTTIFLVWWVISALNQFRSGAWTLRLRRHIPFGVIPLWTFFAPNPARADSRLVWREHTLAGWGEWQEMHFGFATIASRWLYNPSLILNKAISDLTGSLLRLRPELDDRSMLLNSAYVALLNMVLVQPRLAECGSIQFAIVRTSIGPHARRVELAFLSEVHDVADAKAYVC